MLTRIRKRLTQRLAGLFRSEPVPVLVESARDLAAASWAADVAAGPHVCAARRCVCFEVRPYVRCGQC